MTGGAKETVVTMGVEGISAILEGVIELTLFRNLREAAICMSWARVRLAALGKAAGIGGA